MAGAVSLFAILCVGLWISVSGLSSAAAESPDDAARLLTDLLQMYNKVHGTVLIPRKETVNLKFGVVLINAELDSKNLLNAKVWYRFLWNDYRLRWDASSYGNITHLRLPADMIWRPDIVLFNKYRRKEDLQQAKVVVYSDGNVLWVPSADIAVQCSPGVKDGEHYCSLKFGSWTYDGEILDINFYNGDEHVDVNDYIVSNDIKLVKTSARKNVKYYPCCAEPYPDLTFDLVFEDFEYIKTTNAADDFRQSHLGLMFVLMMVVSTLIF